MKKLLFILISLLIGIGVAVISLEIFLRLNPKFGYIYNSFKLLNKTEAPQVRYFNELAYQPSALLGYEHIPNSGRGKITINSNGLIGKEYKLKKDKGVYRMLLLGDSIAAKGQSYEFLEDELNNNFLLHQQYRFEIWNAGVGSYDVRRYALYLKYKGLVYKPDMVIIFFCMNDLEPDLSIYYKTKNDATAYSFSISEISKKYTVDPFLLKHSFLYRLIILRLNSYLLNKKKALDISSSEEHGRYYLQMIKETCENNKIPLFLVIFPYLKPQDEYQKYQIEEYKTISKVIKALKINYLNLYEFFPVESLHGLRDNKEDEIHPSREAHRIIAKIIYDRLLDNYFNIH